MAEHYKDYAMGQTVSIKGENVINEFVEYYVDEKDLDEKILHYLYATK
jgi:hypothetical protein